MHRHDSLTAAVARALVTKICLLTGRGPVTTVLICDDRATAAQGLAEMLLPLPSLVDTTWVMDGFALVDAYARRPVDLVLIGVHGENNVGRGHWSDVGHEPDGGGHGRRLGGRCRTARGGVRGGCARPAGLGTGSGAI